jgi:apurinic endonuclease APN1
MKSKCDFNDSGKLVGGHVSIAGGIDTAPERASEYGFNTFQIFVKSNLQWKYREITEEETVNFKEKVKSLNLQKPVVHATYLLNLGSENKELVQKSMDDLKYEIAACNRIGVERLVLHPGSNSDRNMALKSIMDLLNSLETGNVTLLIENSSGKGNTVPATVEEMAKMLDLSKNKIGICLDTCHFFADGYDLRSGYKKSIDSLKSNGIIGHIGALHINDSMFDIGSKKDRHENIGKGYIGDIGFSNIINDKTFNNIPMIMETPGGEEYYKENIEKLKNLLVVQ